MRARPTAVVSAGGDVRRIVLSADDFTFDAGQYVEIRHPDGLTIPFSLASAPERLPEIEIHFRPLPGRPEATALLALLTRGDELTIDGPFGDVSVRGPTRVPLVLCAGGSGIGQCLAIVEHLTHCAQRLPVRLVWSVREARHLYGIERLREWQRRHAWFAFDTWIDAGDRNGACDALEEKRPPGDAEVIVSGGPGFVYAVTDTLAACGFRGSVRSDVFAYAPR
jgi:NAD(P)H-flavin reductase